MFGVSYQALRAEIGFFAVFAAFALAARLFELAFPIEPNQPRREIWLDCQLVAVSLLIPWLLSSLTSIVSTAVVSWFGGGFIHLSAEGWNFIPSVLIFVVALDLVKYWTHRTMHIVPALWAIHSFHHSAEAVTFVTGARHHWMDRVLNMGLFPLLPILLWAPPEVVLVGNFLTFFPDTCAHLNVRLRLGRFVMWFNSPQYHRIHHSVEPQHFNKNFAAVLPLWDVVFGTAWRPGRDEFPATGLPGGEKPRHVWDGIIWPLRGLLRLKPRAALEGSRLHM